MTNVFLRSLGMNHQSSRSHCIFTVILEQRRIITNEITVSRLSLVDLAGSEKVSKTRTTGSTLDEARSINQSLSTLGNVINALVEGRVSSWVMISEGHFILLLWLVDFASSTLSDTCPFETQS